MNVLIHPDYVRRLLVDEYLERAECEAVRLGVRLREPPRQRWPRWMHEQRATLKEIVATAGNDAEKLDQAVAHLARASMDGTINLRLACSATPWLWLVRRFLRGGHPQLAARAASRWHLISIRLTLDLRERIPERPFIAFLGGALAAHVHEDADAAAMLRSGVAEGEALDEGATGSFLQACRWARTAVQSARKP